MATFQDIVGLLSNQLKNLTPINRSVPSLPKPSSIVSRAQELLRQSELARISLQREVERKPGVGQMIAKTIPTLREFGRIPQNLPRQVTIPPLKPQLQEVGRQLNRGFPTLSRDIQDFGNLATSGSLNKRQRQAYLQEDLDEIDFAFSQAYKHPTNITDRAEISRLWNTARELAPEAHLLDVKPRPEILDKLNIPTIRELKQGLNNLPASTRELIKTLPEAFQRTTTATFFLDTIGAALLSKGKPEETLQEKIGRGFIENADYIKSLQERGLPGKMAIPLGFALGVATPGLLPGSPGIAKHAGTSLTKMASTLIDGDEMKALRLLREGVDPRLVGEQVNLGALQKAAQRLKGLGDLADLDNAMNANNKQLVEMIVEKIKTAPADAPVAAYKATIDNYVKNFLGKFSGEAGFISLGDAPVKAPKLKDVTSLQDFNKINTKLTVGESIGKVMKALKDAVPIRAEQEALYSAERSRRIARAMAMGEKVSGEKGFFAQLGQLKGELPKVQFESLRKQVTQVDIDNLFTAVEKALGLSPFEKITTKSGLAKLLGAEGGMVPTRGEIALLNKVFPREFTEEILAKRPFTQKLFEGAENVLNLPRSMMATADLSAPLRQGVFLIGKPKQWLSSFKSMFKYAVSEDAYKGLLDDIASRPTYEAMRANKLALTDLASLTTREESFMSNIAEHIPGFGTLARGANRAYSGFLNKLRADTFDDLYITAQKQGLLKNPKVAEDISKFINSATGRGEFRGVLSPLTGSYRALSNIFFSPRLMASRLNLLDPTFYTSLDPFVRKEALKSLFTFAGTGITLATLAKLGGADVGTDPRSADFAKIKVGNTRYDPWGGFQQYIRAAAQLITGQYISTTTGKQVNLGEGYNAPTRKDIAMRFLEGKEAPIASFITDLLEGKTGIGEDFNLPVAVIDRFIPMVWQDAYELYKERGLTALPMELPALFGVGVQTYGDQIPMATKTPTGKPTVKWRQPPSLGEDILNTFTGKKVSNIPQSQWKGLQDERRAEKLWDIELGKIKAQVLETGKTQIVTNPITKKRMQIYMDKGILKTKTLK